MKKYFELLFVIVIFSSALMAQDGLIKSYYQNKMLKQIENFKNGKLEGEN